jgi:hypothetical protein
MSGMSTLRPLRFLLLLVLIAKSFGQAPENESITVQPPGFRKPFLLRSTSIRSGQTPNTTPLLRRVKLPPWSAG